ncbi:MAG: ribosomal RNA small subunit methyltransferase A, partial [Deltaproteobacteria bacterium]|nr:ribosomal RNA small subunit methyltransferase A [Deltaproteobacteria bacterium]
ALDLKAGDKVLEIGPGSGAMTLPLAKQVAKFLVVEKDIRWVNFLREELQEPNIKICHEDFLHLDFGQVLEYLGQDFKVLSNLPYESSVAILLKLLEQVPPGTVMVLMFQKEVAMRLLAKPRSKDYGSLSVWVQVLADLTWIREVSPQAFYPPPQVDSGVLKIIKKSDLPLPKGALPALEQLLRSAFGKRRKMLRQNLRAFFKEKSAEEIEALLEKVGASPQARAEELSVTQWAQLLKINESI